MTTNKGTQSGLPSFDWTPQGALIPAAAPRTHLTPRGVQTNLGKSLLVFEAPIWVEILSFIWQWSRLPAPSHLKTYRVGSTDEISGAQPTHGLDAEWGSVERY